MTTSNKILGQSKPSATTLTAAYTCASSAGAIVTGVTVCNQSATPTTFRISVAIAGASDTPAQYLCYDYPIDGFETIANALAQVVPIANTDVIRVYNTAATLSFNVLGQEIS